MADEWHLDEQPEHPFTWVKRKEIVAAQLTEEQKKRVEYLHAIFGGWQYRRETVAALVCELLDLIEGLQKDNERLRELCPAP